MNIKNKKGFIYYLPGAQTATPDDLQERGVDVLDGASYDSLGTSRGPDGGSGFVIFPSHFESYPAYQRLDQTWVSCRDGKFWLGWWTGHKPTADDLKKSDIIDGHDVRLEDGNLWTVPLVRRFPTGTALPASLLLDSHGKWKAGILPRHAELTDAADRVFESFLLEGDALTYVDMADIAAQALAINYHVDRDELGALGVLSTANVQEILGAMIDLPTIIQLSDERKKKASDSSSLNFGEAA